MSSPSLGAATMKERWFVCQRRVVRNAVLARAWRVHQETELQRHRGAVWNLSTRSRHDAEDEIYELEELSSTAVSQAPRSLP